MPAIKILLILQFTRLKKILSQNTIYYSFQLRNTWFWMEKIY